MNDDFLHRIRKTPPPRFLADLKSRLDRQPMPAPAPRRLSFLRGLILGALLGSAALAIAAAALDGMPHSLRALVQAPEALLARIMRPDVQQKNQGHTGVVPLNPFGLPDHAGPRATPPIQSAPAALDWPARSTDSATLKGAPTNSEGVGATSAAGTPGVAGGPIYPWYESLTIIATTATYPLASALAARFNSPGGLVKAEIESSRMRWCVGDDKGPPEVFATTRRITPEELRDCQRNGAGGIIELKIGYQAIELARAKLYGPLNLSTRDLFRALARRIPATGNVQTLVDNPNLTWNQVNPALPDDRINVIGPAPASTPGRLLGLLLEQGCNTYPWLAAQRETDGVRYNEICRGVREDGVYASGLVGTWMYTEQLIGNPTAIGIFSLSQFEAAKDKLSPVTVDGVQPTVATIANGTYPLYRTVYLYANKRRVALSRLFGGVVHACVAQKYLFEGGDGGWGYVRLDNAESAVTLANLDNLKELQF